MSKNAPASSALLELSEATVYDELVRAAAMGEGDRHDDLVNLIHDLADPGIGGSRADHVQKYKFMSGNIIELMKGLQSDFEEQLLATNKAEQNAVNAFQLSSAARQDMVDAAKAAKKE